MFIISQQENYNCGLCLYKNVECSIKLTLMGCWIDLIVFFRQFLQLELKKDEYCPQIISEYYNIQQCCKMQ